MFVTNASDQKILDNPDNEDKPNLNQETDDNNEDNYSKIKENKKAFIGVLEDLPVKLIDNEYIKTGYRINYHGFCLIFKTMFKCHNETFNIWSHFIGKVVAISIAVWIICGNPMTVTYEMTDFEKSLNLISTQE